MSASMKSSNASPDNVAMPRSAAATDARLCSISSVTTAGSVSIGSVAWPNSGPGGALVGERPEEAVALDDGLQRVPGQRIGSAQRVQDAGAARRRGQPLGDVDEQAAAGLGHRRGRRHLPEGQPEGLHGVGHHLLVADGDVDVVLPVAGLGDREQRGDRPALDDLELAAARSSRRRI